VNAIEADSIVTRIGGRTLHDGVSFSVPRGKIVALIGASGVGKSVLLRELIGLARPAGGTIRVLGTDVWRAGEDELNTLRRRFGMMFQDGALFSSLTVAQNVATPLRERGGIPPELVEPLVRLRIAFAGLPPEAAVRLPSELSGGMRKRVAIARALVTEPEIVFFDEPTTGLDPVLVNTIHQLIVDLHRHSRFTAVMVSHEIPEIFDIADRVGMLHEGRIVEIGPPEVIQNSKNPIVQQFIRGEPDPQA